MFLAVALSIAALGFMCWLLFNLAVYALPFFAGVTASLFAYETGAGAIGAMFVGIVAAAVTLVFGQVLFASARSPVVRTLIATAYATPAALAGYHAVHGLTAIGGSTDLWRQVFAVTGAIVIAAVAWSRVSAFYPGDHGGASEPALPTSAR